MTEQSHTSPDQAKFFRQREKLIAIKLSHDRSIVHKFQLQLAQWFGKDVAFKTGTFSVTATSGGDIEDLYIRYVGPRRNPNEPKNEKFHLVGERIKLPEGGTLTVEESLTGTLEQFNFVASMVDELRSGVDCHELPPLSNYKFHMVDGNP